MWYLSLFPMVQRYKFESKSQQCDASNLEVSRCFQWFKGTNLKANHNKRDTLDYFFPLFPMVQRYKFESKSQLSLIFWNQLLVVSNGSKVQIWKQITTYRQVLVSEWSCFQWFKGTNLKANHNRMWFGLHFGRVVSNGSKVQIWKQITTTKLHFVCFILLFPMVQRYKFESKSQLCGSRTPCPRSCFQWFKGTNLKANHNFVQQSKEQCIVVSNGSKVQIWKQITT